MGLEDFLGEDGINEAVEIEQPSEYTPTKDTNGMKDFLGEDGFNEGTGIEKRGYNDGVDLLGRMDDYEGDHCWQYDIRVNNRKDDLEYCGLTEDEVKDLKTSDFIYEPVTSIEGKRTLIEFIQRHEWLGTISMNTTHWFAAYYVNSYNKHILAGVTLMNVPNAFSKVLGEDTKEIERLISRGACISWSPKNLASNFLMWSIRWMVDNTPFRVFSAYSDPTAKELGTIYQACNWFYIGKTSGAAKRYINPYTGKLMSDRNFRMNSFYKKYAEELNIRWDKKWEKNTGLDWSKVPDDIEKKLRELSRKKMKESESFDFPLKHKYYYVLGQTKKETKQLQKKFLELNKTYPYPKERGN